MDSTLAITGLHINGMAEGAVVDSPVLGLTLWREGLAEGLRVTIWAGEEALWDSGLLPWQPHLTLEGMPLTPCRRYELRAELLGAGQTARASLPFATGLMGTPWQGRWIEPVQEKGIPERPIQFFEQFVPAPDHFGGHGRLRPAQELRRTFYLKEQPCRAALCASAHGVYALWVNGRRADERRLAPETTCYESLLYYQVYDLAPLLRAGENEVRVLLADGWWIGRIGLTGDSCQYGDRLAFLGQLEVEYPGGEEETIVTDGRFEARPSFIRYSDLFMGERWDLSAPEGTWTPCRLADWPLDTLALQPIPPIRPWTAVAPVSLDYAPNGELVADFGQCLAGVAELRLTCPAGREVILDHSETLDGEGNFFRNILGRNKDQQDAVVCREGETFFCPEFTYHGFRYLRLTGARREEVASLRAIVLGTPLEELGDFSCSDPRLTRLQQNIRWSTRSNMVSVPTDCPQREKQGWTGDILAFAPTGCFNYDLGGFLSAWLAQMRLEQRPDGEIPIVVPSFPAQTEMQTRTFGGNSSAAWSDACVLIPLALYRAYGDKTVLRENLPMMERWLTYVARSAAQEGDPHLWTAGYHFGDWLIPSYQDDIQGGTAVTAPMVASCQYALTTEAFVEVLEALGEPPERIAPYRAQLTAIRQAVRRAFLHEDGTVDGGLQGLYVMALRSGAAGELADKLVSRLAQLIADHDGCLDTGFVSVPHLLDVLTEHGHEALAWQLLFQTKSPSWLYQVEQGATSIWENWNAIRPDGTVTTSSFNHYALGCVGDWIYRHIGGLRPQAPGWRAIEYAPAVDCGLDWADCHHRTPYGLAACRWRRTAEGTRVEVTVPHGVRAQLTLPGLSQPLAAGTHHFTLPGEKGASL